MKRILPRSWPAWMIAIGVAVRLLNMLASFALGSLPTILSAIDVAAALSIVAGAGYFLVKGLAVIKRRLLWRVRRKLIISYIFVGFVPVMLVAAFFALGGVLLFFFFSAYLVRDEFSMLEDRARTAAHDIALAIERTGGSNVPGIVNSHYAELSKEFTNLSIAVLPITHDCTRPGEAGREGASPAPARVQAGPWAHVAPPARLPAWVPCAGFGGLFAYGEPPRLASQPANQGLVPASVGIVVRGVGLPEVSRPHYTVIVDLVLDRGISRRIREAVGVAPESVTLIDRHIGVLAGRQKPPAGAATFNPDLPMPSLVTAPLYDWESGRAGSFQANTRLSIPEIYRRITTTPNEEGTEMGSVVLLLLQIVGALFLIIEAFALLVGLTLAKSITGSVHELSTGTERVRHGDFSHKIASTADDQLGELASSFNSMTASMQDLLEQAAEKRRLEEELRIAHEIQMSLLPHGPLKIPGISVTALCVPAREVGGDYYDFLPIDEHRLGILIADVSGKGTSAALYMAELKGLVLSLSRIHTSPRALLIDANRIIARHLDARSFITITYAVLDLQARTMTYARAGHTPLMLLPGATAGSGSRSADQPGRARVLVPGGMVLGLKIDGGEMFEKLLEEEVVPLRPGDVYLFFTDGITEAMNASDDTFGEARLGRLLEQHAHLGPEELRERVLREIKSFVGDEPQHDDMTMILLRIDDLESRTPRQVEVAEALAESA
jgi:serine phosphatase RsbU (regulator of sigma subunit)